MDNKQDFYVKGILHCGKCGYPKQVRLKLFGQEIIQDALCKCETEKRDQENAAFEEELRRQERERMRRAAFPDEKMASWTFAKDDKKDPILSVQAHNFVRNFKTFKKEGKGLMLYGPVGTGKTFITACIANALIDDNVPCLVTSFPRLVNEIQGIFEGRQEYIDSLNDYDLLVIDDLASERNTDYMNEIVMNVVDARYTSRLPLIVSTNLTKDELLNPSDLRKQRVYSRLMEICHPILVDGKDRRRQILRNSYNETDRILKGRTEEEVKG